MKTARAHIPKISFFFLLLLYCFICPSDAQPRDKTYVSEGQKFKIKRLTYRSDIIWGFDFLSADKIIFTERGGKICILDLKTERVTELKGVPSVHAQGQGGMLDVSVVPESKSQKILFSYSYAKGNLATTAVGYGEVIGDQLKNFKQIFQANAWSENDIHYGSRIVWETNKTFFLSVGDRDERKKAQDLNFHNGKILRLNFDGTAAKGNPFENQKGALPEIWSYGHRNPQGLTLDHNNNLFEAEFGPRGGDEINLIFPKKNYGWPLITYGKEYWGPKIGEGTHKEGMQQPLVHWTPSISPSGISFYNFEKFPKWKNNLFIANLSSTHLRHIVFSESFKILKQEPLLEDLQWRIRDVQAGPDGNIYLSSDNGILAQIHPTN